LVAIKQPSEFERRLTVWKYNTSPSGTVFQFIEFPPINSYKSIYLGPMLIGTKKEADILLAALICESTAEECGSAALQTTNNAVMPFVSKQNAVVTNGTTA
jgi:hypothetical protein